MTRESWCRVLSGSQGQFTCGNKRCDSREGLCSYELNFKYAEHGQVYNELVKVRRSKLGHFSNRRST